MPASIVTLPLEIEPVFARRCVVCGATEPTHPVQLVGRDGRMGAALWAGWYRRRVPACRSCGRRLQLWRIWKSFRTLAIAGGSLAFGLIYLLPRYEGWLCGLIVLGLCIAGFSVEFIWNQLVPPAFDLDAQGRWMDYQFKDPDRAQEFATLNGAEEQSEADTGEHPI